MATVGRHTLDTPASKAFGKAFTANYNAPRNLSWMNHRAENHGAAMTETKSAETPA